MGDLQFPSPHLIVKISARVRRNQRGIHRAKSFTVSSRSFAFLCGFLTALLIAEAPAQEAINSPVLEDKRSIPKIGTDLWWPEMTLRSNKPASPRLFRL